MALPATITPITVTGTYVQANGAPARGAVQFTPSITALTSTSGGAQVPMAPVVVALDANGAFSTVLAATNDADWSAPGWTYQVTEMIAGAPERSYNIAVPFAGGPLNLAVVAPVAVPGVPSAYLLLTGGTVTGYTTFTGVVEVDNDVLVFGGNVSAGTVGKGLKVKEGAGGKQGVATLVAGTVTVANGGVTASSRIFLTAQSLGTVAAPKALAVTARVVATSFTITSADATDTSVIAWEIFEPAP